LANFYKKK